MNSWIRRGLQLGIVSAGLLAASATAAMADSSQTDDVGVGNGSQVAASTQAPASVCGNAIAVLGDAAAFCDEERSVESQAGGSEGVADSNMESSDNVGIANGTQIVGGVNVPLDISGNAVGILGDAVAGTSG